MSNNSFIGVDGRIHEQFLHDLRQRDREMFGLGIAEAY